MFPDAHFVYLYRDGRSNVSSLIDGWENHGHFGLTQFLGESPVPVAIDGGRFREWSFFLPPGWRDYNNATLEQVCAFQWMKANEMALEARSLVPAAQWTEIRYEDLLDQPVPTFERVFARLGLALRSAPCVSCAGNWPNARPAWFRACPSVTSGRSATAGAVDNVMPQLTPMLQRLGYDA